MSKTVAKRAAELGLDEHMLVRVHRLLSRSKTQYAGMKRANYWYRQNKPLISEEQAAQILGVDLSSLKLEYEKLKPRVWKFDEMKEAMFAFYEREGRWPKAREYSSKNQLPPYRRWASMGYDRLSIENVWQVRTLDVWERLIARDRRCTPEMALALRNTLARKEAIDRIGFKTFLRKKIATVRDEDPEWGTLYEMPGETTSEPMLMLKVINSTAEPDGTFSEYYLRVPPDMKTAREAVRWTFGGDEMFGSQMYEPLVQT